MVELAELIGDLREELTRAVNAAPATGLRFELGPIGLEVSVTVSKEAKPGAKVRFWVIEAGVDSSLSHTAAQKITLTLQPSVSGGSAYVAGKPEQGEE
jgi:hypothetical protein